MSYSAYEFVSEYQGLVRSLNPLNYFFQFDSTSERNHTLILTDLSDESDRAKKCSTKPSVELLNNFPNPSKDSNNLISYNSLTKLNKNK